jgi:hypothetical protein
MEFIIWRHSFIQSLELSIADSYFIAKQPSTIALAILMNTIEELDIMAPLYLEYIAGLINVSIDNSDMHAIQRRLRLLCNANREE